MKTLACLLALAMLSGVSTAGAQQVLAVSPAPRPAGSVLPPPSINASGVKSQSATTRPKQPHAAKTQSVPLPSTGIPPSLAPALRQQEEANGTLPPQVAVTTNANGNTVETYSRNGHVFMVQVTPKHGITQTYYNDSPNGSLMHNPNLGRVGPVYYTLYKWGAGPKPPTRRSNASTQALPPPPLPPPPPSSSQ